MARTQIPYASRKQLELIPNLLPAMLECRHLPPSAFEDSQWQVMEALVEILPLAVAELRLVFRDHGTVDFSELAIRASRALGESDAPSDLALALGYRLEHLLVDEFQDTSYTHFELLKKLTAGWDPGDGRTLFWSATRCSPSTAFARPRSGCSCARARKELAQSAWNLSR